MKKQSNLSTPIIVICVSLFVLLALIVGGAAAAYMFLSVESVESSGPVAVSAAPVAVPEEPGASSVPVFVKEKVEEKEEVKEDHEPEAMTPERYEAMTGVELLEYLSYYRLHTASPYDKRVPLDSPFELHAIGEDSLTAGVYSGVGAITYMVTGALSTVYAQWKRPKMCAPSWSDDETQWDFFDERCQNYVYSELVRQKYGRKLYKDMAKLDGKTLKLVLDDMRKVKADTPMLGVTAAQIYRAVAPAVSDYLKVWAWMQEREQRGLLKRYKRAVKKRGVVRKSDGRRDMVDVYYSMNDELEVEGLYHPDYSHTIIGFWLRRMNDGTAKEIAAFMTESEKEFGE